MNRNRADTDYDTVMAINLENVRRFEVDAAQRIAESYAMLLEAAHWAFLHFYQSEYELAESFLTEFHNLAMELRDSFSLLTNP